MEDNILLDLFASLSREIIGVKGDLANEIAEVKGSVLRMEARLDKIAAGAHYVTRLVEWSEKQDKFQAENFERLNDLTERVRRLEGRGGQ